MYTTRNFKTKKQLKEAVAQHQTCQWCGRPLKEHVTYPARSNYFQCRQEHAPHAGSTFEPAGKPVTLFAPGLGSPKTDGTEFVEGPHYPAAHTWYAQVTVKAGVVVGVK
jgi:hypothetical protein